MTAQAAAWPLVGRVGELRLLGSLLSRPEARGLVLAGPAGVGKTRLATEALQHAERLGLPTARASASRAAARLPFGAVAPLLPEGSWAEPATGLERADLLRRFAGALTERARGRRLVLLIDDAHLLDDASATLVYQLATAGTTLLLATVRTGERAPDPVLALWKDGLLERLELDGLDGLAVRDLLADALGGPVDPATVVQIATRCRGNALYLRELVLGALQSGALVGDGGLWRLVRPLSPSGRLVELIGARLADVGEAERELLEALALGEPLSAADLAALADARVADGLERAGLLTSRLDGRRLEFHLAHPLHGEVLRQQVSALRRRTLAGTLARGLEATGARRSGDELRLATWLLEAGGGRAGLMLRAAKTARRRYDFPLAERLARAALQDGAGLPAAILAAQLAGLSGRGEQAEAELAALAERAETDEQRGQLAVTRVENLRLRGRFADALALADEAVAGLAAPRWRDEVTARRAAILLDTQGPAAAAVAAGRLCATASGGALGWACLIFSLSLTRVGRTGEAAEAAERGTEALRDSLPEWPESVLVLARSDALAHAGHLARAETLAACEHEAAIAAGHVDMQAYAAWQLTRVHLLQGRVATAARHGNEAAALLRELGRRTLLRDCLAPLATAEALRGDPDAAGRALDEVEALGLGLSGWTGADLLAARAWAAVAAGDMPSAQRHLAEAAEQADAVGDLVGEAAALHDLARIGGTAAPERLAELAARTDSELVAARAAHVAALAARDPGGLDAVSARFEECGAALLAAEAAADAGAAWQRSGEARRSAASVRRADTLANRCEAAPTPALRGTQTRGLLTPAERQVALLAAAGRSNRDIAAALTLSLRTVENRLHRIYEKLGICGRADLAAAMED